MNWSEVFSSAVKALPSVVRLDFLKGVRSEIGLACIVIGVLLTLFGVPGGEAVLMAGAPVATWGLIDRFRRNRAAIDAWQARVNLTLDRLQEAADAAERKPE